MRQAIVLDSGPLGLLTHPPGSARAQECTEWLSRLLIKPDVAVVLPEIIDYEIRREIIRADFRYGLDELNSLKTRLIYLRLTTEALLLAAELWAATRARGRPTTGDKELDIDVILAAQALSLAADYDSVVIATTNVGHLSRFIEARVWQEITVPPAS